MKDSDKTQQMLIDELIDLRRRLNDQASPDSYHESLEKSIAINNTIEKIANIGSWEWVLSTNTVSMSDNLLALYGLTREEFDGQFESIINLIHPDDRDDVTHKIEKMIEAKTPDQFEFRITGPEGEERTLFGTNVMRFDDEGEIVRLIGMNQDITGSNRVNEALTESERSLREAQALAKVGSWSFDINSGELIWSDEVYSIFGLDKMYLPSLEGLADLIHPDDLWVISPETIEKNTRLGIQEMEYRIVDKSSNEVKYVVGKGVTEQDSDGNPIRNYGTFQDITERKRVEKIILDSLAEKETLLKEIHHRVKNNLQIVSSLLHLQADSVEDKETISFLKESQGRIKTMALLHEHIYESEDLAHVNTRGYVAKIIENLAQANNAAGRGIEIVTKLDDSRLDMDIAISIGLIVNELVTNAFKHAFSNVYASGRQIKTELNAIDEKRAVLTVGDNGVGLEMGYDAKGSLGMELVRNLINQIDGNLAVSQKHGAEFSIEFSISSEI